MLNYVKKEDRYEVKDDEEYVVIPKSALDTLLEDYYDVSEGYYREEMDGIPQEEMDDAIHQLDTGLHLEPHQVKALQTMFKYYALDDVSFILEGDLDGTETDADLKDLIDLSERIGDKLSEKHIESEYDFNKLVHQLKNEYK